MFAYGVTELAVSMTEVHCVPQITQLPAAFMAAVICYKPSMGAAPCPSYAVMVASHTAMQQ